MNALKREIKGYPVWGWLVFILIVALVAWGITTGNMQPQPRP